jgi:hypothetical protein
MVAQRVFGLALGYEDLIDHDQLRHDPVLAALAGKLTARRKSCAPLAGKSTLNRLEHAPAGASRYHKIGHAIESLFVALFLEAHKTPPKRIVLDLDATDDPLHGHQEGRFFHGYYDGYCYLPLYVFCGRHLLAAKLRRSNIDASAGALAEVERSGLEPDPRHYQAELAEEPNQRLRLTRHLGLSDHPSGPIHHTQAALFQRHVDPGIMLHGLSREDAWGRPLRTPFTSSL